MTRVHTQLNYKRKLQVGESGVSWATPLNSTKKAGEKMFMSSIVWSYSKDLLHHAALKIHFVVGKFQGEKKKGGEKRRRKKKSYF